MQPTRNTFEKELATRQEIGFAVFRKCFKLELTIGSCRNLHQYQRRMRLPLCFIPVLGIHIVDDERMK